MYNKLTIELGKEGQNPYSADNNGMLENLNSVVNVK